MLPGSTNYLFYRLEAFGGLETPIAQRRAADGYVVRNALRQLRGRLRDILPKRLIDPVGQLLADSPKGRALLVIRTLDG